MKNKWLLLSVLAFTIQSDAATVTETNNYNYTGSLTVNSNPVLTNEVDTLATVLARGNDAVGQSVTNFGGLSSTGVVDLASKSGLTNSPSRLTVADQMFENLNGGTYIGRDNVTQKRELANLGVTWTLNNTPQGFERGTISVSSDGKYQLFGGAWGIFGMIPGGVWLSSDYGQSWLKVLDYNTNNKWNSVAISADGKHQVAVNRGSSYAKSSNYGTTWGSAPAVGSIGTDLKSISISSDGKFQTVVDYGGKIYVSSDFGDTFTEKDSNRNWMSVSISSDGRYQTAVTSNSLIYISSDYGNNWTGKESATNWVSVAVSSHGKYQTTVISGGKIYVSSDYGNSWTEKDSNRNWLSIAMSSDGKYQVASDGSPYISSDYGETFTITAGGGGLNSTATISSDGKYISSCGGSGQGVYVSVADEVVRGNLIVTNGTVAAGGGFYAGSNILPTASNVYDIGSASMPFRHGYFGTNSLYLGQNKLGVSSNSSLTYNNNTVPTNISVNGNLGVINDGVAYANVDIPNYDPVNDQIFLDKVSGREVSLDYATATLASGITNEWYDISASSNGLVVAALSRNSVDGLGYVYIGTNGPNSLEQKLSIGQHPVCQIYVLPDGSKVYYSYYTTDPNNPNGSFVVTDNNGSSWTTLYGPTIAGRFGVSDNGLVVIFDQPGYAIYKSTNGGVGWANYTVIVSSGDTLDCAVSGNGNVLAYVLRGQWDDRATIYVSTNTGASWLTGKTDDTYGLNDIALSYDGSRLYLSTHGPNNNGQGRLLSLNGPSYSDFVNLSPSDGRLHYKKVDCSADGRGVILVTERGATGSNGTVYVSTNYGVTLSSPTNLVDAGGGTEQPHWIWGCSWVESFSGGYAVKGGSGDGKIYKVEIGSVVTNTLNLLGDATIYGSLSVDNSLTVNNEFYAGSNILPTASNQYDIGSSNMPFRHGYFGTNSLYLGDYKISKAQAESWDAGVTNGNFGSLSSTGLVDLASKSGDTNSRSRLILDDQLFASMGGGTYIGRDNVVKTPRLVNVAAPVNWPKRADSRGWKSVAISSDGQYQTAVAEASNVYISADYGMTWVATNSVRNWISVAISANGQYQTAAATNDQIYISSDYGHTWTAKESSRQWSSVAISSDGKCQTAIVKGGQIYISVDNGNNWTAKDSIRNWKSVAMSSGGRYQTAVVTNGYIYISSDYGSTWTPQESVRDWRSVAVSSDGKFQIATCDNGESNNNAFYISTDYGNTWIATLPNPNVNCVAMSSDGKYISIGKSLGSMSISTDYGNTWSTRNWSVSDMAVLRDWTSVAMSSDGKYQTAVAAGSGIFGGLFVSQPADEIISDSGLYIGSNRILTNESSTLATTLLRGNSADGLSATNFGGLSSTGIVNLASKSGLTNSPSRLTVADQLIENLDGGTFIGRDIVTRKRELANIGETWVAKNTNRNWTSVALSSDGKYQTAVGDSDYIYVSQDYGNTWTNKDSSRRWESVALSSDGKYQIANDGAKSTGRIYMSKDYGQTWASITDLDFWASIAISSDGKYLTAVSEKIYISRDYGTTWITNNLVLATWSSVAVSSDGKHQTAVAWEGQIYTSSDYGITWSAKDSSRQWRSVSISSDGRYQTAVVYGGQIYVSQNYGITWSAKDSSRQWRSVSISSDGRYQTAVADDPDQIYISLDYGNTWTAKESSRSWTAVSISSDGKHQTAVVLDGQIYVSVSDEVVQGNLVVTNGSITAGGGFYGNGAGLTNIIAPFSVISTNGDYSVTTYDCNKMIVYTGSTTNTFYLPSVGAVNLGTHFWFSKVGSGKMIIAATNSSRIADSGVNGTIYNASTNETYATMHLMLAATNQWVVGGFFGTWTTTTP